MLKPCPFCGCEAVLVNEFFDDYLVMCSNSGCAAEGPLKATSDEAETAWNTRPSERLVDELIEAYRAVVYEEACLHCDKGETWTVKCPDGTYLGETWGDSDGQANAEEMAEALNCAYKQGYAAARAEIVEEE